MNKKQKRQKLNEKYEPQLIGLGARYIQPGIYELDDWFLYPTKAFAMNKKQQWRRIRLSRFIKRKLNASDEQV